MDCKCAAIDNIISKQEQIIEKLKEYKLSIITEAVTKGLDTKAEMKDSGNEYIGTIPHDWEICRLRNIGRPQNGISKGGDSFGYGTPFVSYGDVYKNFSLPETVTGLIDATEDEQDNYSVEKGDIFFTRTSETIEEVLLKSMPVLLPPDDEQDRIADYLNRKCNTIDKMITEKQGLINKWIDYKKSLIYEVVTGKKEV